MKVLVIHGPNLNLLGRRETQIYGTLTLDDINRRIAERAADLGVAVEFFQSNHEGEIIDRIQAAADGGVNRFDAIVINPGAYSHYSIAIGDAIAATEIPAIEVHITNICAREPMRRRSVVAPACRGIIAGLGHRGYLLALEALAAECP